MSSGVRCEWSGVCLLCVLWDVVMLSSGELECVAGDAVEHCSLPMVRVLVSTRAE